MINLFQIFFSEKTNRLSFQLLKYIIIWSSVFAILATTFQLYLDYKMGLTTIENNLQFIEESYLNLIATSTYKIDSEQLNLGLKSILTLTDIVFVQLKEFRGEGQIKISHGSQNAQKDIIKEFPLIYSKPSGKKIKIGILSVAASFEGLYNRLFSRLFIVLSTNIIKMFFIALSILLISKSLIMRHLNRMADFTQQIDFDNLGTILKLNRKPHPYKKIDELDHIVAGINALLVRLKQFINEKDQSRIQIEKALKDKEILLRELYHRTKNNMNVINSILAMQSHYSKNKEVSIILKNIENRIESMALVHQKLYKSMDLSHINFDEYIIELADLLLRTNQVDSHKITLEYELENVKLMIDYAVPCGLIINELITNSIKHAFQHNANGKIKIQLKRTIDGEIIIQISDNGIGVPDDFDFRNRDTLGIIIILSIGENQLQGTVDFEVNNGLICTIHFKDNFYDQRV